MKKLTGIIRKSKYSAVKKELIKLGITFFFHSDLNCDFNIPNSLSLKGMIFPSSEHVRCSFFVVVPNELEDQAIQTILKTCYTNKPGDGMIFVTDVSESYRIDDQQYGVKALNFNTL